MHADEKVTAYGAASQAMAAGGVRQLAMLEFEDPDVASVSVEVDRNGFAQVTLSNIDGVPIGGYVL